MITFGLVEILRSVLMALCFGIGYAIVISFSSCILGAGKMIRSGFCRIVRFNEKISLSEFADLKILRNNGATFTFLSVLTFAVLFVLLSYISLDGEIRIYMLALFFASFYLSNFVFSKTFNKIALLFIRVILNVVAFAIRVIILPIKAIFGFFKKKSLTKGLKSK